MHAILIENPTAHNVTPASLRVVERALEATFDLELVTTQARGHAADLAWEAVEAGAKTVIAYGGDGTVNEVVNGLLGTEHAGDVVFAALPGGGTNVLARTLGYPNDLVEATAHLISLVEQGAPRRLGLGRLEAQGTTAIDRLFTFSAGVMLDADTVRRVGESGLRPRWGDLAYIYCAVRAFFGLKRQPGPAITVETPDGATDVWWACLSTSDPFTYLGSRSFRATPHAGDGQGIDLVAGRSARTIRTARWALQALRSARHVDHAECLHLHGCATTTIRGHRAMPLQVDGEYLGEFSSLTATFLPDTLSVWA